MRRLWRMMGMAGAGGGVAAVAVVSQLWWLTSEGWQLPVVRVVGAMVGGGMVGVGLWWIAGKVLGQRWALGLGMGLGAVGLGTGWAWVAAPGIFGDDWAWVVGGVALVCVVLAWAGPAKAVISARGWRSWAGWVVAAALVGGALLRLAGIGHGLPHYIMHCDTPKQLERIPWFVKGNLDPLSDYPMGHIYLYSGVIAAARALSGMPSKLSTLAPGRVQRAAGYILSARGLQLAMGLGVVALAWAVARALWGPGAGALAAVLVALDPLHMTYSRQVMGEVPQCVWVWLGIFCGIMLMKGRSLWWALAGGVCAGLGVATKIYGGYALALVWAGALLSQGKGWGWKAGALAIALVGLGAGITVGSPYLWVDPAGWWKATAGQSINQFYTGTSFVERLEAAKQGLIYLWELLWRRYGPVWMGVGVVGMVWVVARAVRGGRQEVFFGVGLGIALALVVVFRLRYLREWDLVNLVPFLEVAAAGALAELGKARAGWARWGGRTACAGVIVSMMAVGVSDAWVAMAPDTRVNARRWVITHARPGQRLAWNLTLSGAYAMWLPQKMGLKMDGGGARWDVGVEEWGWFGSPPGGFWPRKPGPVALFNLRNYFWENPIIACYIRGMSTWPPAAALGPRPASPGGLRYLLTPWARRRPLELAAGWAVETHSQEIVGVGKVEKVGWIALGRGRARLIIGPGIGKPFKVERGEVVGGVLRPVRALVPIYTPVYKFALIRSMPAPIVWVGLFAQPVEGAPLAARMGNWELAGQLAEASLSGARDKAPAEAWLWAAAGAAARGNHSRAKDYLSRLDRLHPGFIENYLTLKNFDKLLPDLGSGLNHGSWSWPVPNDDRAELYKGHGPQAKASGPEAWIASGRLVLPGPWKLVAELESSRAGELVVIARMGPNWTQILARRRVDAGRCSLNLALELTQGPAIVELHLKCPAGQATIHQVEMHPDWQAELRWRSKKIGRLLARVGWAYGNIVTK